MRTQPARLAVNDRSFAGVARTRRILMKKTYEEPAVSKRGKLADTTAKIEPKVSGVVIKDTLQR